MKKILGILAFLFAFLWTPLTHLEYVQIPNPILAAYVPGLFISPVIQQPEGNSAYVYEGDGLTEFSLANKYGSAGLLAHNNYSGKKFFDMEIGQIAYIFRARGDVERYSVTQILRFRAEGSSSIYNDFTSLDSGYEISSYELFLLIYGEKNRAVFQTCIAKNGNENWGRLFVILEKF